MPIIDDYPSASALQRQLDAATPFNVRPAKPLLKAMRARGTPLKAQQDYAVSKVLYSGDEGGILCTLTGAIAAEDVVASLTHLIIDPAHPLAERVQAYQRHRTHQLRAQNQSGFAALVNPHSAKQKRKRTGGFGT